MKRVLMLTVAAAATFAFAAAGNADDMAGKRKVRARPAAAAPANGSQYPIRMVEIRPGYWISSWGCYTDDGNGRLRDCSASEQR